MRTINDALALGVGLQQCGRLAEAEAVYGQILSIEPACADAWHLLGVVACQQGNDRLAVDRMKRALELDPDFPDTHNSLGLVLNRQGKFEDAIGCYRRALDLKPDYAEAYNNLGNSLKELQRTAEAISYYRRALATNPTYAEAHYNLGVCLYAQQALNEAILEYRSALALNYGHAPAHNNLGVALNESGQLVEAAAHYRHALELVPDYADAHFNNSLLTLLVGDFERGWQEFEYRWERTGAPVRTFAQPRWTGQPIGKSTILLMAEQGFGDTFQFVRYAPLVKRFAGAVVVECPGPLVKILAACPGIDRVIPQGQQLPAFDFHVPLMSLPGIFKTTLETVPASVPYLFADAGLIELWREKLGHSEATPAGGGHPTRRFRIGINWAGRDAPGLHKRRDIPIEKFAGLAAIPGVQLISLQKGSASDLAACGLPVTDVGEALDTAHGAFMDTAAIMMNLDLVITSDTSIPHLAGALGVPVWLALPFVPDWRWMLDRSDSPWYPTMRLFRQKSRGDWAGVFEEIEAALRERLGE